MHSMPVLFVLLAALGEPSASQPGDHAARRVNALADRYYAWALERTPELAYFAGVEIERHDHQDHASGGAVFADTAELVGHERMVEHLTALRDDDAYADVRPPDRTCSDELTVELGGKRVRMIHALPSHGDDSSNWAQYNAWRAENVEAAYRSLKER